MPVLQGSRVELAVRFGRLSARREDQFTLTRSFKTPVLAVVKQMR
jgi:hypothetical protein